MEEGKEPVKPWERPWTTEEMRHQSANWNLAGDAGLLKHLQEFSQNLLARTHATEVALDSLMEELRATSTDVSNVTNQFLCLANTQFVENRVYDDDEKETPPEEKKEEKPKSKEEQEAEVVARVREALTLGISVLDTMFEAVEVPGSDSEDEESGGRVVLEPRNPYLNRPLPYLIGSRQFMEDDNIGLGSQSDSEETGADKNLVQSSDSESDMDVEQKDVPKKRTRLSSTSASENSDFGASDNSDLGPGPGKQKKLDSSDLFGNVPPADSGDMFGGDSPEDDVPIVDDTNVKRNSFAAELAAKLGGVAATEGDPANKGAPKLKSSVSKPSMVWEDEDNDDGLFGRQEGKYSGRRGLFDDLEDSPGSLWDTKEKPSNKGAVMKEPSLFSPDTENEDDIFSDGAGKESIERKKRLLSVPVAGVATSTPITDSGFLESEKTTDIFNPPTMSSLFDGADLDDNLFDAPKTTSKHAENITDDRKESENKKKKPVGGVSMFGSVDVFKAGIRRPPSSSSCSSDESEKPHEKELLFNASKSVSSITKNSEEQHSTKSKVTAAAAGVSKQVSLFDGGDDNLFSPVVSTSQNQQKQSTTGGSGKSEQPALSNMFQEENASDSLFSKPQKSLQRGSTKSTVGGSTTTKQTGTSRKPTSLFNDSDSGDDELLFSSTSSTSSRSRRSQGSGDLLASSSDKIKPPVVQKKGLFDDEDVLFGGLKDDPGFDIFSTGTKPNPRNLGGGDLFGDGEDNVFKSSKPASLGTSQDIIKNGSKDILFGDEDDNFDIFNNSKNAKSQKIIVQAKDDTSSAKNNEPIKPSSEGLFSDDPLDDIFAIPVNTQKEQITSKVTLTDSLFSGNSALASDVNDLFSEISVHEKDNKNIPKTDEFSDQTDGIFSIPKIVSSVKSASEKEIIPKDFEVSGSSILSNSESVTNKLVDEVLTEQHNTKLSGLFSDLGNESEGDLFSKSVVGPPSTKPVIPNKPVIKQKPMIPSATKPTQIKNVPEESDIFSSVEESSSKSSSISDTKGRSSEERAIVDISITSQNEKTELEKSNIVSMKVTDDLEKTDEVTVEKPSIKPTKPEPPKTLNIRKTTDLLFHSSSNEDEDLFGLNFSSKGLSNLSPKDIVDEKLKIKPSSPQENDKPKLFSTDKRSKSEKEISSKLDFNQENISIIKPRSVGASPRQLNIDPSALLPGAKPPPRGQHNAEAAVSFDRPAESCSTLHSAGKGRARIQAKRRPPSRKARQEAVRKSGLDFEAATAMSGESVISKSLPKEIESLSQPNVQSSSNNIRTADSLPTKENAPSFPDGSSNNLLSPSTDEEDLFGVPQDLPSEYESNKDDEKSLFTSAPVLSPLEFKSESLTVFPEEIISTETEENNVKENLVSNDVEHADKIPKESLDKISIQTDNILTSKNILDDKSDVYDSFRNAPPIDDFEDEEDDDDSGDLFSVSKKKVAPLTKENNLFESGKDTDSLFSNIKSLPENILNPIGVKTAVESNSEDMVNSQKEIKMPQNDPLSLDNETEPKLQNIPKLESTEELFSSGPTKQTNDMFQAKKTSSDKVDDDLFLPPKSDKNSIIYGSEDDLFSANTKTLTNKENKTRSSVEKSNVFIPKQEDSLDDDSLFLSGKQNQTLPTEDDLFSSTVKNTSQQTPSKKENFDLFGGNSPEGEDLFFSTSKKKVGSTAAKEKSGAVTGTSVKGSLFDEDDDDAIFGGSVKSRASNKPSSVPIDNEDSLFGSSSKKKKPQLKVSNPTASSSSRQAVKEDDDMFEDPLMVITKK